MSQSSTSQATSPPVWWRYLLELTLIVAIYVATGVVSGEVLAVNPRLPLIWLPSGTLLAIVMIGGYRHAPGVAIGVFVIGVLRGQPVPMMLLIAPFNMMTIIIAKYLLQSVSQIDIGLKRMRDVFLLVVLGGFGSMLLGAMAVMVISVQFIDYPPTAVSQQFASLWLGSSLSVLFVTPLILSWYHDRTLITSLRRLLESVALVVFSVLTGWLAFSNVLQLHTTMPIFYLLLPPFIWAMMRFRLREVTLVNAITIGFLLWSTQTPGTLVADMLTNERIVFTWSTIAIGSVALLLIKVLIDDRHTMEQNLKIERDLMSQMMETLGQGITVVSKDGLYEYVNPAFARLVGKQPEDLIGRSPYETIAESFKPELDKILQMRREGKESTYQAILKGQQDEDIIVFTTGVPRYINGKYVGSISVVTDIRPLLDAEQARHQSEAFFRAVFENSADSIVVVDKTGRIVMSNRAHQTLLGYSADALSEMSVTDYIHPDDVDREEAMFQHARTHHEDAYQLELRYVRSDNTIRWVEASVGIVWDGDGQYQYAIGMSRDITESRNIKLAIEQSEKRFRAIFENASLPIAVTREDRKIGMVNQAFCNLIGYSEQELRGMRFDDFTYPGDNDENLGKFEQLILGEIDNFSLTKRYVHRDGSPVWAKLAVSRFTGNFEDVDGNHLYTIAIAENITDRKLAEDRLNAEMRLNERLLNALPGIFFLFDEDGDLLRWNRQLEFVTGLTAEELESTRAIKLFPRKFYRDVYQAVQEVFEHGHATREYPILHRDGHLTPYLVNGYRIVLNDMTCIVGVGIDISELKETESALRKSEERYRTIFENSLIGIYRSTTDGRFLSVNPAIVEILGYDSAEELYELDIARDVYVHPEKRNAPERLQAYEVSDVVEDRQVHLKKKNGDVIIASVRAKIIRDDQGDIAYFEGSLNDITEQYRHEEQIKQLNQDLERRVGERTEQLEQANEQLLELDRLRAKFIADMSHEMRTPLAVLNTRLYLLQHSQDQHNLEKHIDGIRIQLERLQEFVENAFNLSVLDISRDNLRFDTLSLNTITQHVIEALAPRAEVNGLTLDYNLSPLLPDVVGVENHLSQVVTNLIHNAIKYTSEGQVKVSTGFDTITNRVYLRVEDSGMGIAREDIPHLFSRFYRGARAGQSAIPGTGLGLSIVKEIVDTHDGHIDVESQINEGSVFTVWLPVKSEKLKGKLSDQGDAATRDE